MSGIVKENLLTLLGSFPENISLNPVILESTDCGSYIREKVEYSAGIDDRVRAYVLIPKNRSGSTPAVFCHHQHAGNFKLGKSEVVGLTGDPDQVYAKELAERGYIAFAPDAIAFEELTTLSAEISWSHNVALLSKCADLLEREFYMRMSKKNLGVIVFY
jgi:hypothetical protein